MISHRSDNNQKRVNNLMSITVTSKSVKPMKARMLHRGWAGTETI